jgi:hypothetical protein
MKKVRLQTETNLNTQINAKLKVENFLSFTLPLNLDKKKQKHGRAGTSGLRAALLSPLSWCFSASHTST